MARCSKGLVSQLPNWWQRALRLQGLSCASPAVYLQTHSVSCPTECRVTQTLPDNRGFAYPGVSVSKSYRWGQSYECANTQTRCIAGELSKIFPVVCERVHNCSRGSRFRLRLGHWIHPIPYAGYNHFFFFFKIVFCPATMAVLPIFLGEKCPQMLLWWSRGGAAERRVIFGPPTPAPISLPNGAFTDSGSVGGGKEVALGVSTCGHDSRVENQPGLQIFAYVQMFPLMRQLEALEGTIKIRKGKWLK